MERILKKEMFPPPPPKKNYKTRDKNKYLQQNNNFITSTHENTYELKEDKDMDKGELEKINSIRTRCGALFNTSRPGTSGPYFNHVTAPVD